MAKRKLSMRKIKQILRLKLQADLSDRATARSVKASRDTVREYLDRAKATDLITWDQIKDMAEADLEGLLFPPRTGEPESSSYRLPDWKKIHQELRRKGVTRHLLWHEYLQEEPAEGFHDK